MKPKVAGNVVGTVATVLIAVCISYTQSTQPSAAPTPETNAKPLLLEKDEGELRTRRIRTDNSAVPSSQFMLKVSPKNNGSQHLVLATEEVVPGGSILKHKHFAQDEILLIETGEAHVSVGDQERDLHGGGLVFIPTNTWVSLKNTGTERISLVFIFSAPGVEHYLRCTSVPAEEKPTQITPEQRRHCAHEGHTEFEDLQEKPKK
jgi:mannose-6-phosphate isomerase-like protein (cupin superfamily)